MKQEVQPPEQPKRRRRAGAGKPRTEIESALVRVRADAQKLLQELQLRQIELEMQDEEMQRARRDLKESWAQFDVQMVERTTELARAIEGLSEEVRLGHLAETALHTAFTETDSRLKQLEAENTHLQREIARLERMTQDTRRQG